MAVECFFNQQVSDALQHIAVFFEVGAIALIFTDYKNRERDLQKKGRAWMLHMPIPHPKRRKELYIACAIGVIAVLMEIYQLASQYLSC